MGLATAYLMKEHEQIESVLKNIPTNASPQWDVDRLGALLQFFSSYADHIHHAKEEDILFRYLDGFDILAGGPHCGYYSELRLMRPSVQDVITTLNSEMKRPALEGIPPTASGPSLQPIYEEHAIARKFIERLNFELNEIKKDPARSPQKFFYDLNFYKDLLTEHIRKENTCLFYMIDSYFDDSAQKIIVGEFEKSDEKNTNLITTCQELASNLLLT